MAPPSAIGAWARGADLALVASGVDQLLETVVTGPNIKTPAELKGRKVGVSRYGSLTDLALREALHHYKLVPDKDVTILQTGGEATRFAALTSGAIDGATFTADVAKTMANDRNLTVLKGLYAAHKEIQFVLKDPKNPWSNVKVRQAINHAINRQDIIDKARDLITPVLGAATSQKLIDKVFAIENVKNLVELRPLLQRA